MLESFRKMDRDFGAVICVSGGFDAGTIKDANIFEKYEQQDQVNFQSALLGSHLASHLLQQQGFLMLTGSDDVFKGPVNFAYAYAMSKTSTHALALNLAADETFAPSVVTILPQTIDTEANRKAMPDADHESWTPTEKIADLVFSWANGKNRPQSGAFARIDFEEGCVKPTFL